MNSIKQRLEDMLIDEEEASDEYVKLADDLYRYGLSKEDATKVFHIASDERRHFNILKAILKKL